MALAFLWCCSSGYIDDFSINTFIQEGDSKDICSVTKYFLFQINAVLNFLLIKQTNCFQHWQSCKKFLEHLIILLEWFLKDHVTLKSGVIMPENSALQSQE